MTLTRRCRSCGCQPAFTLIELLAVIVIVSLVAGIATIGLASASQSAQLHAAAAEWRDLDGRARLFGRSLGQVVMSLNSERTAVMLHVTDSKELLSEVTLPDGASGQIQTRTPNRMIAFDRLGRSVDYEVQLQAGERVIRWRVYGLTGLIGETRR